MGCVVAEQAATSTNPAETSCPPAHACVPLWMLRRGPAGSANFLPGYMHACMQRSQTLHPLHATTPHSCSTPSTACCFAGCGACHCHCRQWQFAAPADVQPDLQRLRREDQRQVPEQHQLRTVLAGVRVSRQQHRHHSNHAGCAMQFCKLLLVSVWNGVCVSVASARYTTLSSPSSLEWGAISTVYHSKLQCCSDWALCWACP
jgi:hypothetical protein